MLTLRCFRPPSTFRFSLLGQTMVNVEHKQEKKVAKEHSSPGRCHQVNSRDETKKERQALAKNDIVALTKR